MIRRRIESASKDYGTFVNSFDSKTKKIGRRIEKIKKDSDYGGSRMWKIIHEADNVKLPTITKPPRIPLFNEQSTIKNQNPFRALSDLNFTKFLENEEKLHKEETEKEKAKRVEDRSTYSRKTKQLPKVSMKEPKLPPMHVPKSRNIDENGLRSKQQPLSEHIQNMRQRRLILYSAHIMREEMNNLDEVIEAEQKKLSLAEVDMRQNLQKLDNVRMDMDQKHIEARQLTRQLVLECHKQRVKINKITSHKMSLELDISDAKEKLTDYKMYHDILKSLFLQSEDEAGKEVDETNTKLGSNKRLQNLKAVVIEVKKMVPDRTLMARKSTKPGKLRRFMKTSRSPTPSDEWNFDTENELGPLKKIDVYFESPQKVIELCTELYYQNITRILKFRQIEDELKETQTALFESGKRNEANLVKLTDHIKERSDELHKQKTKLRDVQIKVMIHSAGSNLTANKESDWESIKKKVSDVYISLLGKSKVRISTQQKMTNIENRIYELLYQLEVLPSEKVEAVWQAKSKEKHQRIKELCYKDLRDRRKKLIRKSWKNVSLAIKRGASRKLVYRSMLAVKKKDESKTPEKILSYDDDMAYYFSA